MKTETPLKLIVTDDTRVARMFLHLLDKNRRGQKNTGSYWKLKTKDANYIIISTNGHLQVFQNSSIYKWSGIDPRKIIEDPSSVIPVLNSFNKDNYYNLSRTFTNEPISECIMAFMPDVTSLTVMIKELGNLIEKTGFKGAINKLSLASLESRFIFHSLSNLSPITFSDRKVAEAEYLRSFLDAIISFSITQELTYTVKRCLEQSRESFEDLRDVLKHDLRENRNLMIPMSRAQALILKLIDENNKKVENPPDDDDSLGEFRIFLKFRDEKDSPFEVIINNIIPASRMDANGILDSLSNHKRARIAKISASESNKQIKPPGLYNLNSIITELSRDLGFPTTYIYRILLDLYYSRLISYPNSQKTTLGNLKLNHEKIIADSMELEDLEEISRVARDRVQDAGGIFSEINQQVNVIAPLASVGRDSHYFNNKDNHWKVYNKILARYLLQFLEPSDLEIKEIDLELGENEKEKIILKITIESVKNEGFLALTSATEGLSRKNIEFNMFKSIEIEGFRIENMKKKVEYFTDASLLKEIKKLNLGDTISYLMMVEKLIGNNYIQVINKHLKLTRRGRIITEFLNNTYDFIGTKEFSNYFMEKLELLDGVETEAVLHETLDTIRQKILAKYLKYFDVSRERTNSYLMAKGIVIEAENNNMGVHKSRFDQVTTLRMFCNCGSPMRTIETKAGKRFIACENRLECGNTAALPNEGSLEVIEKKCLICDKHILKINSKVRGVYYFCPTCWTDDYRSEERKQIGYCASCTKFSECWDQDLLGTPEFPEKLKDLHLKHSTSFERCPRCQESNMILLEQAGSGILLCENPFCNYKIDFPAVFLHKIERTEKQCLICPMKAIMFEKVPGKKYYVCLNCFSEYNRNHRKEIGFCIGCQYHDACFESEMSMDEQVPLKELVRKKLAEDALNRE
ncbi:MAG: DNA topoisomerase [Promethearchaeota archaeon]